jgi:type I restriction enzyme M protein
MLALMKEQLKEVSSKAAQINCKNGLTLYNMLCLHQAEFIFKNGGVDIDSTAFNDADYEAECKEHLGYFISKDNLYSSWMDKGSDFHVSDVMDACNAFNRHCSDELKQVVGYSMDGLHNSLTTIAASTQEQTRLLSDMMGAMPSKLTAINDVDYELTRLIDEQHVHNPSMAMGM